MFGLIPGLLPTRYRLTGNGAIFCVLSEEIPPPPVPADCHIRLLCQSRTEHPLVHIRVYPVVAVHKTDKRSFCNIHEQQLLNAKTVGRMWEDYVERGVWRQQIWYVLMFMEFMNTKNVHIRVYPVVAVHKTDKRSFCNIHPNVSGIAGPSVFLMNTKKESCL